MGRENRLERKDIETRSSVKCHSCNRRMQYSGLVRLGTGGTSFSVAIALVAVAVLFGILWFFGFLIALVSAIILAVVALTSELEEGGILCDAHVCPNCGNVQLVAHEVATGTYHKPVQNTETPKSFMRICVKCKKQISIASEECPYCGARQPRLKKR